VVRIDRQNLPQFEMAIIILLPLEALSITEKNKN
jgi:hypothetical protein